MEQNKQYKFNEFNVSLDEKGKIIDKMPTKRKSVVIYPHEAEWHNERIEQTKVYYELDKKAQLKEKTPERIALEEEAIRLEISFTDKIGDEKLQERINTKKEQLKQ